MKNTRMRDLLGVIRKGSLRGLVGGGAKAAGANQRRKAAAGKRWPDPQQTHPYPSTPLLRGCVALNFAAGALYMHWRFSRSMEDLKLPVYSWMYLMAEVILVVAIWTSHFSRMFPVRRPVLSMDDLVARDPAVGDDARCAMLCPTAGEKLRAFQQVLFGAFQQRLWDSSYTHMEQLRVIVLDEKRRPEVYQLAAMTYGLAELLRRPRHREGLLLEGLDGGVTLKEAYAYLIDNRHRLPESAPLTLATQIRALILRHDDRFTMLNRAALRRKAVGSMVPDVTKLGRPFEPGFIEHFCREAALPHLVYFARSDAGCPRASPKAGNMNAALFPHTDNPGEPLIGGSDFVMVNDARHCMEPEYLQRTCPYFFRLAREKGDHGEGSGGGGGGGGVPLRYRRAGVGFVQVPQRFPEELEGDPLGNHAAIQYEVANVGRDGIGAMMSCGHGSIWSMKALGGERPDGASFKPGGVPDAELVGHVIGFKAEILIEDTHSSINLFHHGWRSAFVSEPGEALGWCVHQPDSVKWRVKQVFRWHMGAVQLWLMGWWPYKAAGAPGRGGFPSRFHYCIMFDATTYFFQAFAGQVILALPVVYGISEAPPFKTYATEFIFYFFPFLLTGLAPTIIGMHWKKASTERVMRDEQTWFATAYVHIYAFLKVVWQRVTGASAADAWRINCPSWPLFSMFFAIVISFLVATYNWVERDFEETWVYISSLIACAFSAHAIWPMCALGLHLRVPPMYYGRFVLIIALLLLISYWDTEIIIRDQEAPSSSS